MCENNRIIPFHIPVFNSCGEDFIYMSVLYLLIWLHLTFDFISFAEWQLSVSTGRVGTVGHVHPPRNCTVHTLYVTSPAARWVRSKEAGRERYSYTAVRIDCRTHCGKTSETKWDDVQLVRLSETFSSWVTLISHSNSEYSCSNQMFSYCYWHLVHMSGM